MGRMGPRHRPLAVRRGGISVGHIDVRNAIGSSYHDAVSGLRIDDIGPLDGTVVATLPRSDAADVARAVEAARAAQPSWAALSLFERANGLDRLADTMEAAADELAHLEALDTGKPWDVARHVDIDRCIRNFRFFAAFGRDQAPELFRMDDATNHVIRKPIGIVGLISPWNLPLYLLTWKVAPALLMGNAVIAKPSELTPLTAHRFSELVREAGLDGGLVNVLHGFGPEVGQALVEHPAVEAISFTGGTATGRIVAATAAPMFKKLSLELGGKNATVVLDDADIDAVLHGVVRSGFLNSGQICLCGSRVLVPSTMMAAFLPRFVDAVQRFPIGPVISEAHRSKVEGYLQLAVEEGGTVLTGGERGDGTGFHLSPAVVAGLSPTSRCATEEIFGPVVTVHPYSTEEEALDIANGTEYGLAGSVWTSDAERGRRFAERMDTGMVWVNTWLHRDLRVPFGGVKQSGVGREGGMWSLGFFSEAVNICVADD
jgi:aminomuconate-semialdehyde/2-hydroxymuconate-6-semialdehyde dehydrogenase